MAIPKNDAGYNDPDNLFSAGVVSLGLK